jgi:5-methylcytosine-specific restriction protein B
MITVDGQKENYSEWVTENLGEKTGMWYAPYLEKMGIYLEMFELAHGYQDNFFAYQTYEEFARIYGELTGETQADIAIVLEGITKHYPKEFVAKNLQWNKAYAKYTHEKGERSRPDNFGGIANLGSILRSYLKFLYYDEHQTLIYPKREKKIAAQEGEVDGSSNYWVISPGENARLWYEFISDGTIGLGWDYLGDLNQYDSRMEIEQAIAAQRDDGKRPFNDSKAVWDFYHNIQINDTIYVKAGIKKILGKGVVIDNYYFDDTKQEYKHRRKVDWIQTGEWNIRQALAQKTLTSLSAYPDLVFSIEKTINEEEFDESSMVEREFKLWLAKQVDENGIVLNDKTILSKIYALKNIEKTFQTPVFGEIDAEILRELKESVLSDNNYRYKGVAGSSLDYYIRYLESQPVVEENEPYPLSKFLEEVYLTEQQVTTDNFRIKF